MTQHTPGEWVAVNGAIKADGRNIAIAPQSAYKTNLPKDTLEVFANMRLMAAAPEMLAAIEALLYADKTITYNTEFARRFERAVELAKRAQEKIES